MDEFSSSDIECLDESLVENQHLTYNQLKDKSHDSAYKSAGKNRNSEISPKDMIRVGGADDKIASYVQEMAKPHAYAR
jgi:hypothetical protein